MWILICCQSCMGIMKIVCSNLNYCVLYRQNTSVGSLTNGSSLNFSTTIWNRSVSNQYKSKYPKISEWSCCQSQHHHTFHRCGSSASNMKYLENCLKICDVLWQLGTNVAEKHVASISSQNILPIFTITRTSISLCTIHPTTIRTP